MASTSDQFFVDPCQSNDWVDFDQFLNLPAYGDESSAMASSTPDMALPYDADMLGGNMPEFMQPAFPDLIDQDIPQEGFLADQSPSVGLMPDLTPGFDDAMCDGSQSYDDSFQFQFRQMVEAQAAADQSVASIKEKRREASIALHLQRLCDATALDLDMSSDSNTSFSSPSWSDYMRESISPQPAPVSHETTPAPPSAAGNGGVELVLDLNMNTTTNLPKKQKPRSQAQKENYIKARKYGACEKHKKQHKRVSSDEPPPPSFRMEPDADHIVVQLLGKGRGPRGPERSPNGGRFHGEETTVLDSTPSPSRHALFLGPRTRPFTYAVDATTISQAMPAGHQQLSRPRPKYLSADSDRPTNRQSDTKDEQQYCRTRPTTKCTRSGLVLQGSQQEQSQITRPRPTTQWEHCAGVRQRDWQESQQLTRPRAFNLVSNEAIPPAGQPADDDRATNVALAYPKDFWQCCSRNCTNRQQQSETYFTNNESPRYRPVAKVHPRGSASESHTGYETNTAVVSIHDGCAKREAISSRNLESRTPGCVRNRPSTVECSPSPANVIVGTCLLFGIDPTSPIPHIGDTEIFELVCAYQPTCLLSCRPNRRSAYGRFVCNFWSMAFIVISDLLVRKGNVELPFLCGKTFDVC